MDASYIATFSGLIGAAVGGLTSLGTTWISQQTQLRAQQQKTVRAQRERLFVEFMNEAGRLYADALGHEKDDVADVMRLYAIVAHLRMVSGPDIVAAAEHVVRAIVDAYQAPNRTLHDIGDLAANGGLKAFRDLGAAFRTELAGLGPSFK